MNILLWIVQAILAIKLITVTLTHGLQPNKPTIQEAGRRMGRACEALTGRGCCLDFAWDTRPDPAGTAGLGSLDHAGDCCSHGDSACWSR